MTASAMGNWNALDNDEIIATAEAFRRLLDGGRLGAAQFTRDHSLFLLAVYGDDDHFAR